MTTAMTKRLARAVLIAGLALPAMMLLPANAPFAITKPHAEATTMAEFNPSWPITASGARMRSTAPSGCRR
jgi:hypothetical protein